MLLLPILKRLTFPRKQTYVKSLLKPRATSLRNGGDGAVVVAGAVVVGAVVVGAVDGEVGAPVAGVVLGWVVGEVHAGRFKQPLASLTG